MATLTPPSTVFIQSVLDDSTNKSSVPRSPILRLQSGIAQTHRTLRRSRSLGSLKFNLEPEERPPSKQGSIHNALVAVSREGSNQKEDNVTQTSPASIPLSPSFENLDVLVELSPSYAVQIETRESAPTSHSNWPVTQLETITEQHSVGTLRKTVSLPSLRTRGTSNATDDTPTISPSTFQRASYWPRLYPEPPETPQTKEAKRPASIDTQQPAPQKPPCTQIHTTEITSSSPPTFERASYWPPEWNFPANPTNRRCFSESEVSCLKILSSRRTSTRLANKQLSVSTSKSSDGDDAAYKGIDYRLAFPQQPAYPLPHRSPTPPGLPSFGTQAAVELLMVPHPQATTPNRAQWPLNRRSRRLTTAGARLRSSPFDRTWLTVPGLWNLLSGLLPCSSDGLSKSLSRQKLARNVPKISPLPAGFVARADDGTPVRGRFGGRTSGHGVGAGGAPNWRGLEGHPFHHANAIQDIVREIDKACANAESQPTAESPVIREHETLEVPSSLDGYGRSHRVGSLASTSDPRPVIRPTVPSEIRNTAEADDLDAYDGSKAAGIRDLGCLGTCWHWVWLSCCGTDVDQSADWEARQVRLAVNDPNIGHTASAGW